MVRIGRQQVEGVHRELPIAGPTPPQPLHTLDKLPAVAAGRARALHGVQGGHGLHSTDSHREHVQSSGVLPQQRGVPVERLGAFEVPGPAGRAPVPGVARRVRRLPRPLTIADPGGGIHASAKVHHRELQGLGGHRHRGCRGVAERDREGRVRREHKEVARVHVAVHGDAPIQRLERRPQLNQQRPRGQGRGQKGGAVGGRGLVLAQRLGHRGGGARRGHEGGGAGGGLGPALPAQAARLGPLAEGLAPAPGHGHAAEKCLRSLRTQWPELVVQDPGRTERRAARARGLRRQPLHDLHLVARALQRGVRQNAGAAPALHLLDGHLGGAVRFCLPPNAGNPRKPYARVGSRTERRMQQIPALTDAHHVAARERRRRRRQRQNPRGRRLERSSGQLRGPLGGPLDDGRRQLGLAGDTAPGSADEGRRDGAAVDRQQPGTRTQGRSHATSHEVACRMHDHGRAHRRAGAALSHGLCVRCQAPGRGACHAAGVLPHAPH
mmetsp:Transcript_54859/g.178224  ORF Transcript_54859/g.178224 Transcript_54859/m.178224 type:complete len:495 (+) Transcript_54859:582-2066(+)